MWALGYPDRSAKKMGDAFTLAQELPHHPYSLAWAQFLATLLSQYRREGQDVLEHAEAIISLSTTQEFPLWVALATVLKGWALARQGEEKEGLAQHAPRSCPLPSYGSRAIRSYFLALLAETYGETDR